jgi:hypothetical protein
MKTTHVSSGARSDAATSTPGAQATAAQIATATPALTAIAQQPRSLRLVHACANHATPEPAATAGPLLPPAVLAFFTSPQGRHWLERCILAMVLTFGVRAGVGATPMRHFLVLSGLDAFVAHSARTLQRLARAVTEETGEWGAQEQARLAAQMPQRSVVLVCTVPHYPRTVVPD